MFLNRVIEHLEFIRQSEHKYWLTITDIILSVPVIAEDNYITCPPRVKLIELNLEESTPNTKIYFESENMKNIPEFIINSCSARIYWNNVELLYNL
jgi:hypothetical protein